MPVTPRKSWTRIRRLPVLLGLAVAVGPLAVDVEAGCNKCKHRQAAPAFQPMLGQPMVMGPTMAPIVQPSAPCGCGPAPVQMIQPMPMSTTYLQPQQVVTMQPVTRTEIRREAQTVNVPVTVQRQVTVDEGGYQSVWVPKLVTKNVSETAMQQQIQYRDVAYQVTSQVAVAQTHMVPTQVTAFGVATPTVVGSVPYYQGYANQVPVGAVAAGPIPEPSMSGASANPVATAANPEADQKWSKVPAKAPASKPIELQSYEQQSPSRAAGRFSPAPSAVTVWQSQGSFTR